MNDKSHQIILPYQASWKDKFESEKIKLQKVFNDDVLMIEHIVSTSIEGLASKPIIDMAVLIEKRENGDKFIKPLERLGYVYDETNSSGERHLFRKGKPTEFHLSIAYKDKGNFMERQILFRDYLIKHEDFKKEYDKLKHDLLKEDPTGKSSYISGKSDFINNVIELSKKELGG